MKAKYRLFRRGRIFYAESVTTGKQESLHTADTLEAKELRISTLERLADAYGIEVWQLLAPAVPKTRIKSPKRN
jgi:hypothetical protein